MDRNGNENCLEGLACPACGNHKKLIIQCLAWIPHEDDGTPPEFQDLEWNDDSRINCPECDRVGRATEFRIPEPEPA